MRYRSRTQAVRANPAGSLMDRNGLRRPMSPKACWPKSMGHRSSKNRQLVLRLNRDLPIPKIGTISPWYGLLTLFLVARPGKEWRVRTNWRLPLRGLISIVYNRWFHLQLAFWLVIQSRGETEFDRARSQTRRQWLGRTPLLAC